MTFSPSEKNDSDGFVEPTLEQVCDTMHLNPEAIVEGTEARRILWSNRRNVSRRIFDATRDRLFAAFGKSLGRHVTHSKDYYEEVFSSDDVDRAARDYLEGYANPIKQLYFRVAPDRFVQTSNRDLHVLVDRLRGDAIETLGPASLCEVGSGNGRNLITLANRFPTMDLAGYELTENGTRLARAMQHCDISNTHFGETYGIHASSTEAISRIRFEVGSGFSLPCTDDSFDVTITSAALSCMGNRVGEALDEIHRVTRNHVVLYEPFSDVNTALGHLLLLSAKSFRLSVAQLESHGFREVALLSRFPVMLTHAYGLLVARVIKP